MRRGFDIVCGIASVALIALFWLSGDDDQLTVMAAWVFVTVAAGGAWLVVHLRTMGVAVDRRPQRFVVTRAGFVAPSQVDARLARGPILLALTCFLTVAIDARTWILLPVVAVLLVNARNLGRTALTLTPDGVTLGPGRSVTWGQPVQVPRELSVNPWFVSAAIQWYAQRPEERSTIGTPEGHERLRTALGAIDRPEGTPPRLSIPWNLVRATWLTWFGVVAAVLSAAADVTLADFFRSILELADPRFPEEGTDWPFIAGSTGVWLLVTVVAGAFAIALLQTLRHWPSLAARGALMTFAIAAVVAAFNPVGSPILAIADIDGPIGLVVLLGWIAGKAAVGVPALLVVVLLSSPPVREYAAQASR